MVCPLRIGLPHRAGTCQRPINASAPYGRISASPTAAPPRPARRQGCAKPSASIAGTWAANRSMISSKWVKPWRTWPRRPPVRRLRRDGQRLGLRSRVLSRQSVPGNSVIPPSSPLADAPAQQHVARRVGQPEMHPMAHRPQLLRRLARQVALRCPAGARRSARSRDRRRRPGAAGRADRGPQVEQRLGEVAGPRPRRRIARPVGPRPRGSPVWPPASAVSMANSRAATRSTLPSTGTAGMPKAIAPIGRGGIGADARQRLQPRQIRRKPAQRATACAQACRLRARA